MSADILLFPSRHMPPCQDSGFGRALAAVTVLLDFSANDAWHIIAGWESLGLIAPGEAALLHAFYGWGQPPDS